MGKLENTMDGIGKILDAIYDKFILRDVMAKCIPGILVLVAISKKLGYSIEKQSSLVLIFFIFLSWCVGFLSQSFGECFEIIQYYPKTRGNLSKCITIGFIKYYRKTHGNLSKCILRKIKDYTKGMKYKNEDEWYIFYDKYLDAVRDNIKKAEVVERFVIIKEMCGNMASALILSGFIFVLFGFNFSSLRESIGIIVFYILSVYFFVRMHRIHVKRQEKCMRKATNENVK